MAGYIVAPVPELSAEAGKMNTSVTETAVPRMTNFECVTEEFMKNFGQKVFDTPQTDIFDKDPKTVTLRYKLIDEEVNELAEAMKAKDMVETIDALGDILYVVYGAGGAFGVNLDQAFDLIHKSNMTKLCKTEPEARETVEWYKQNRTGPDGKYPYDTPAYRLSPDGQYYVVFNESTGKILKSINYSTVKFDSILGTSGAQVSLDTSLESNDAADLTNFKKVTHEFMKNFGQKVFDTPQMDIFDKDPKTVDLRLKLIVEEVKELADAMKAKDMVETIDALGDILYVVYGAGGAFGIDLDQAFDLIHKSNMTKLCKTIPEAEETVAWYKQHKTGPEGKYPYDTPAHRLSPDGQYYVVFNESTGKILKSINYSMVKFDSLLGANCKANLAVAPRVTNFKRVTEEFMKNFGQKVFSTPQMDVFDKDPKTVNLRFKLIDEEVNELADAMKAKDMVETVDALGDILYVVYGAGGAFGVDLDAAFDLIHKSNMTKLCKTEAEAQETVEWYRQNVTGPEGKYPYDTPAYRLSPDGKYYVVFNESTGKILKSVNYSTVKFDSILSTSVQEPRDTSLEATNFKKVTEEFMKNFGQKVFATPQMDIFDNDPKTVDLRLKLIKEEVKELADAMKDKDMIETIDALGDILYVVYGAGGAFGIDLDKAFDLIHESNMTKLCKTEPEAKETVEWYKQNMTGPEGKYPYDTPAYRLSPDGQYYVVFNESTGKILKSINYSVVKFDSMLPAK